MELLDEIKELRQEALGKARLVDENKLRLMEKVMAAGFVYEGNTYLGLCEELQDSLDKPVRKRNPMFKDLGSWIPALEYYIELLKEQKKFYEEVYKKQKD
ncbi:hypothetical protein [Bacillus cereus group sp. N21]|uniref:hypothetical protein n=1 Tax=Bacillus cereus group sp. N21 TaxID=2794591 RepID=UPI0018F70E12|nr:hypothetical protein [Bacillus cereus group sp. N21]MBJ8030235.1 hypothetical protein [Bacillus cereus group sp. N21]